MAKEKPYENYFGGKGGSGVYQTIINQIPPHKLYADLFAGNGAIYRHKKEAEVTILNDQSKEVAITWAAICKTSVHDNESLRFVYEFTDKIEVYQVDAIHFLASKKHQLDRPEVFIYLDPPYPFSCRKDQRPTYEHEMTDDQHKGLLGVIKSYQDAMIMISSYPNEMYDSALDDWRRIPFTGVTRQGPSTEVIWMNYPEPVKLHDYSYVGSNYRVRWNMTKSTNNIVNKFRNMSPLVRNAVLDAVISELEKNPDSRIS